MAARHHSPALARTIAVVLALLLTTLLLPGTALALGAGAVGGDHGHCGDDAWLRADWTGSGWSWWGGPDVPIEAQRSLPRPWVERKDADGRPLRIDWTSDVPVRAFGIQVGGRYETFPGVTRRGIIDSEAGISEIVFCYHEDPTTTQVTITKTVEGRPAAQVDTRVQAMCGPPVADLRLAGGQSTTIEVPHGTACGIEEVDTDGADLVAYTVDGLPVEPTKYGHIPLLLVEGQKATVEITNTYLPPEVVVEKAWFADADADVPIAILRRIDDGWVVLEDGPPGYVPPQDFAQPAGFDVTVTHGPDGYTVDETVPDGWQPMACPADAPDPNGLGTFPYQPPSDARQSDDAQWPTRIVHGVCNAEVPPPLLAPGIDLVKTPDVDQVVYDPDDGDDETITYRYVVTNTGEVPLTGLTLVDDVLGPIALPTVTLDVGESTTGTATHVVATQDATAGRVDNTAVVTGFTPDEVEVTATDDSSVTVSQVAPAASLQPGIDLDKSALVTPDGDGEKLVVWTSSAPDATVITYRYVLTNSGETPLAGVRLVDDVLGEIPLTDTDLDVGETVTVTASHTVSAADADAGSITNVATATATGSDGTTVSATADETVIVGEVLSVDEGREQLPAAGARPGALALVAVLAMVSGFLVLRRSPRRT